MSKKQFTIQESVNNIHKYAEKTYTTYNINKLNDTTDFSLPWHCYYKCKKCSSHQYIQKVPKIKNSVYYIFKV